MRNRFVDDKIIPSPYDPEDLLDKNRAKEITQNVGEYVLKDLNISLPVFDYCDRVFYPNMDPMLAIYRPELDTVYITLYKKDLSIYCDAETTFRYTVAHELRHVWQHYNDHDYWWKEKTDDDSKKTIHDPAEIDADAYAMVYLFIYAPEKWKSLPCTPFVTPGNVFYDGGSRLQRYVELVKKEQNNKGNNVVMKTARNEEKTSKFPNFRR